MSGCKYHAMRDEQVLMENLQPVSELTILHRIVRFNKLEIEGEMSMNTCSSKTGPDCRVVWSHLTCEVDI